jgi:hypothetical protein
MINFSLLKVLFFYQLFYIVTIISLSLPATCYAEIREFVEKYHNTQIDQDNLQRIKQFDHLITYFTGFAYFKPNHVVSPEFVKALIIAESSADPKAKSSKDARGLGQITIGTAKEAALSLIQTGVNFKYIDESQLKDLRPDNLYDPAINILLSCFLIAKYNYKYNGKIELVLTAWNAGENTESLKNNSPASYFETENLIGKVNGYYLYFLNNR